MFEDSTATMLMMKLLTAYLFHLGAIGDARAGYVKIQFLRRYPERFQQQLRTSALITSLEQVFITILCETMNLIFLCAQPSFVDLVLNYVAFAGILEIDNQFMGTQESQYPEVSEWIENPSDHVALWLFKDPSRHDRYRLASPAVKIALPVVRVFYKTIYFYGYPIFIIPLSIIGYNTYGAGAVGAAAATKDWAPLDDYQIWEKLWGGGTQVYFELYIYLFLSLGKELFDRCLADRGGLRDTLAKVKYREITSILNLSFYFGSFACLPEGTCKQALLGLFAVVDALVRPLVMYGLAHYAVYYVILVPGTWMVSTLLGISVLISLCVLIAVIFFKFSAAAARPEPLRLVLTLIGVVGVGPIIVYFLLKYAAYYLVEVPLYYAVWVPVLFLCTTPMGLSLLVCIPPCVIWFARAGRDWSWAQRAKVLAGCLLLGPVIVYYSSAYVLYYIIVVPFEVLGTQAGLVALVLATMCLCLVVS